jgi:hypothetical protein
MNAVGTQNFICAPFEEPDATQPCTFPQVEASEGSVPSATIPGTDAIGRVRGRLLDMADRFDRGCRTEHLRQGDDVVWVAGEDVMSEACRADDEVGVDAPRSLSEDLPVGVVGERARR